jgi:hypothetical protein
MVVDRWEGDPFRDKRLGGNAHMTLRRYRAKGVANVLGCDDAVGCVAQAVK